MGEGGKGVTAGTGGERLTMIWWVRVPGGVWRVRVKCIPPVPWLLLRIEPAPGGLRILIV